MSETHSKSEERGPELPEAVWRDRTTAGLYPHLAHRVNNLLSVVLGYGELARGTARTEGERERFGAIVEQAALASGLLRQLGEYAALPVGDWEPIELGPLLSQLHELLGPASKSAHFTLDLRLPRCALIVEGDQARLMHLVAALVLDAMGGPQPDRAAAAAFGPGSVRVRLRPRGSLVVLDVSSRSERPIEPGPGQRVAAEIASAHAGALRTRTFAGTSRCSRLHLPLAPGSEPVEEQLELRERIQRVLVLETDSMLGELLIAVLSEAGLQVEAAPSASAAAEALENGGWDLFLCDRQLGEDDPRLSAAPLKVWLDNCREVRPAPSDGTPILCKPFRPRELLELVRDVL